MKKSMKQPPAGDPRAPKTIARRLMAAATAVITAGLGAVIAAPAFADTAPPAGLPATVSSDPLPTAQINGIVWTQAVAKGTVYAGGEFTQARPPGAAPGTNESPRSNLVAYDLNTGALKGWSPSVNGRVLASAVSPDGSRLYIGGGFTTVNGENRYRLAAFDTATGDLISSWTPGTNTVVEAIAATNSTVYIVGQFSNVNGVPRTRAAALSASTGAVLGFDPLLEGGWGARAIVVSPDGSKVVVAGSFTSTNGSTNPGRGMAALNATTGASLPWAVNSVIRNAGNNAAIYDLASDGDSVYGSGYDFGGSKVEDDFEGTFRASWEDGSLVWMEDCHGDSYSVHPFAGAVYKASHVHYCGNIGEFPQLNPWHLNHSIAFDKEPSDRKLTPDIWGYRSFTGQTAGRLLHWYPVWGTGNASGIGQAGWDITSSGKYLLYGGEFTSINGVRQQGLVRFATPDVAPNKQGPHVQGGAYQIGTTSFRPGQARVSWAANYDSDNAELTYQVFRRGRAEPVFETTTNSTFWVRPRMTFTDTGLTPGAAYDYRVRVADPNGNFTTSDWTPVTVASTGTTNPYMDEVLDSAPLHYWPLNETSGRTAADWAEGNDLTLTANATRGELGQVQGAESRSTRFTGSNSFGATASPQSGMDSFTVEAWFQTTSTSGGKIVGFGSSSTGTSQSYDRHIYINGSGRVSFGVYPGSTRTLSSGNGYNDGAWHHVVGTLGPDGMELFVDGVRQGNRTDTTSAEGYNGYWRVGGDSVSSWPNAGANYLAGRIADVAVYDRVLTRSEVDNHWVASGRTSPAPNAPADPYGASVYGLDPVLYWRLGETTGSTAADSGRDQAHGTYVASGSSGIARGEPGALAGVNNPAVRFTSSKSFLGSWNNRQIVVSSRQYSGPSTYAIEGWFKTTSTGGGKIIGFGNSNSNAANASSSYDRHVYMTPAGALKFGTFTDTANVLTAPGTYNDGSWHHVVAQQSAAGMALFIDGVLAASNSVTGAQDYSGYWRVGGDSTWEGDPFWVGTVDEIAIYHGPLTANDVLQHYQMGTSGALNTPPTAEFTTAMSGLTGNFDGSASSDPEGPIAAWEWDFGDGTTGTGKTIAHTYAQPGTYHVTLMVRDASGLTDTATHEVLARGPNVAPTAQFTFTTDFLDVSVDASTSSDSDGEIVGYAWDFGDGSTGTGEQATHSYAEGGTYEITLTVTDDRLATASTRHAVTVKAPNLPPVADIQVSTAADGVTITADGSGSTDPDGTIVSYAWKFGDGATATGEVVEHTYEGAGRFTISLTATDNDGETDTATYEVTIAPPGTEDVIALDRFERTASNSWGAADIGGTWRLSGGNSAFSVADGTGKIALAPSHTRVAELPSANSTEAIVGLVFDSESSPTGGTTALTLTGRQVGSDTYSASVRLEASGIIRLYLTHNNTAVGPSYVLPGAYTAGEKLNLKLSVTGTSPTALAAKVWRVGTSEPGWQLEQTDNTVGMQQAGFLRVKAAVSAAAAAGTTLSVDDIKAITGNEPAPNQPPTAAWTSSTDGLTLNVDGSGSTDPDGTIVSHRWDFGDGATASGVTASHTYSAAGTYSVALTVTDNKGAKHTLSRDVEITALPPQPDPEVVARDTFSRTTSGSWGAADLGGTWTLSGGSAAFSVEGNQGVVSLAPSHTREARLDSVTTTDATVDVTVSSHVASANGTVSVSVLGRRVGNSNYASLIRLEPTGTVRMYIVRDGAALAESVVLSKPYEAGDVLHARLHVTGTSPTTVAASVWYDGQQPPSTWMLQATDSSPALQTAGSTGVKLAASSISTNPLTRIAFDNFTLHSRP